MLIDLTEEMVLEVALPDHMDRRSMVHHARERRSTPRPPAHCIPRTNTCLIAPPFNKDHIYSEGYVSVFINHAIAL